MIKRIRIAASHNLPGLFRGDVKAGELDYGKSAVYAPLMGLIIGVLLFAAYFLGSYLKPPAFSVIAVLFVYLLLTKGRYFEAFGRGITPTLYAALVMAIYAVAIGYMRADLMLGTLLTFPIYGRFVSSSCFAIMNTTGDNFSGDELFIRHCDWGVFILSSATVLLAMLPFLRWISLLIYLVTVLILYVVVLICYGRSNADKAKIALALTEIMQAAYLIVLGLGT